MQLYNSAIPNLYTDTMNIPSRGSAVPVMYYKPATPSAKCLFFFNGEGETTGPVSGLAKYGPLGWISSTYQPDFSIFCIQGFGWATTADQNAAYAQMKTLLGFTHIAMIGLSEGAWRATVILMEGVANPIVKDTVAFVTMSSQADDSVNIPATKPVVALGIPVLGTGDAAQSPTVDGHAQDTLKFINYLKAANPSGNYTFVYTPGTGHGGWLQDTNPSIAFVNGLSIEAWMEQFFTAAPPAPVKTITSVAVGYNEGAAYASPKAVKSVLITFTDGTTVTLP